MISSKDIEKNKIDMIKAFITEPTAKQKRQLHAYVRVTIQIMYFIWMPSIFTASFAGVKYIFTQIGAAQKIEVTSFVLTFICMCLFTMLFGRFFCGFACAFGTLGDVIHGLYVWTCKKMKKRPVRMKESWIRIAMHLKYVVLLAIVILTFTNSYGKTQGMSPWDVFSMLHAGNFRLERYGVGCVVLIGILVGMAIQERFFCHFLCPMGAVFSMLPVMPIFAIRRDGETCINRCTACSKACPVGISLPDTNQGDTRGDCIQCHKCVDICPKNNPRIGIKGLRGNEIWLSVVRSAILVGICVWIGI